MLRPCLTSSKGAGQGIKKEKKKKVCLTLRPNWNMILGVVALGRALVLAPVSEGARGALGIPAHPVSSPNPEGQTILVDNNNIQP